MTTLTHHSVLPSRGLLTAALSTNDSSALAILRIALGVVIFPHGAQKLFGWFGGYGLEGTLGFFSAMGIPVAIGFLAILAETAGALALIAGFATRLSALGIGITVAVAAAMVHVKNGFFMNWTGQQAGEGFEYHILIVAAALALAIAGGGRWSVDRAIAAR